MTATDVDTEFTVADLAAYYRARAELLEAHPELGFIEQTTAITHGRQWLRLGSVEQLVASVTLFDVAPGPARAIHGGVAVEGSIDGVPVVVSIEWARLDPETQLLPPPEERRRGLLARLGLTEAGR